MVDIIIVGSGAASMMAAITASRSGKSVLVLEKGNHIAVSNAARAGGPALANTRCQREENETVTEEKLYQHMYRFSRGTVNAALLRNAISKGSQVDDIFTACGIETRLIPDTYGVGFRARALFKEGGKKRWQPLADELIRNHGQILFGMNVCDIKKEEAVFYVTALNMEQKSQVFEAKNVILATGGYLGNEKMIREHFGNIHVQPLGNRLSTGQGIQMALSLGAVTDRNWGICANEFCGSNHKIPSGRPQFSSETRYAICGGLLVNREGRRFMNEQYMSDFPLSLGGEMTLREGKFYAVLDAEMYELLGEMRMFEYFGSPEEWHAGKMNMDNLRPRKEGGLELAIEEGWAFCGTIEEIIEKTGLISLKDTIQEYNEICEAGVDNRFGKSGYLLKPISKEPYYLFEYESSAWCTFGGIKTDEFCRALDADQKVIPGLYVAGVDNGSGYSVPYYDNEGAALGLALTMGIVAGEHCSSKINS